MKKGQDTEGRTDFKQFDRFAPQLSRQWRYAALMLGILLIAFALRVCRLDYQSLWRDEVDAIRYSGDSILNLLVILTQKGHNGPLYFVFLRLWRTLAGDTEFALRYFSVVGGVLMVALIYQVARRLRLGRAAAVIAALLIATSPYLLWYSQEAKMYTWLTCLVLVAVYAYQKALSSPFAIRHSPFFWWAIFVVATSLSFYTHILSPLMLLVYIVWAAIQWPQLKTRWKGWLISLALLTLPYLPLLAWQAPLLFEGMHTGHPFYPLPEQTRLLLHFYSMGILRAPYSLYLMAGVIFLILVGLFAPSTSLTEPRGVLPRVQLATWLLIPPIVVYLVSLRVQVFEDRYLIYIAPAFYLLAALGVVVLMARFRPLGWAILTLVVAFNLWGIYRQATNSIKADFRAAAAYIMSADRRPIRHLRQGRPLTAESPPVAESAPLYPYCVYLPFVARSPEPPVVMIQMPYLQYTFDYYYQEPYHLLEGAWTNDDRPMDEVGRKMQTRLEGVDELWLVVSEEDFWDSRHLTRKWLDEHAILQDEKHFVGVDVYNYRMNGE